MNFKSKVIMIILIFLFSISFIYSFDQNSYKKLTDRDRIILSISYYEVAQKYRDLGKEDLYKTYLNEAFKIEKNIEKYIKGELEIPQKKINIDLRSLFNEETQNNMEETQSNKDTTDDTTLAEEKTIKEDATSDEVVIEEKTTTDKTIKNTDTQKTDDLNNNDIDEVKKEISSNLNNFFTALKDKDAEKAVSFFTDEIFIESESITITNTELKESIEGWLESADIEEASYDISLENIGNNNYSVKITFNEDTHFFITLIDNSFTLNSSKYENEYLFDKISSQLIKVEELEPVSENNSTEGPVNHITGFIESVLNGDFEKSISYFSEDIWFDEFSSTIKNEKISDVAKEWKSQNPDLSKVEEVIDIDGITTLSDDELSNLSENLKTDDENIYRYSVQFKSAPILPGNNNKKKFIFIIQEFKEEQIYKIVGIAQIQ